jgi:hypothetical protein
LNSDTCLGSTRNTLVFTPIFFTLSYFVNIGFKTHFLSKSLRRYHLSILSFYKSSTLLDYFCNIYQCVIYPIIFRRSMMSCLYNDELHFVKISSLLSLVQIWILIQHILSTKWTFVNKMRPLDWAMLCPVCTVPKSTCTQSVCSSVRWR